MSSNLNDDETQLETQETEPEFEDFNDDEADQVLEDTTETLNTDAKQDNSQPDSQPENVGPKGVEKKETTELVREPGRSLLPFARVQKIIKADKEIPIIAKDATFLISLATEEFIKRLCEAGQHLAQKEKRATVQHRDIATVVRRVDEFLFLQETIAWTSSDPPAKRSKPKGSSSKSSKSTLLDQFIGNKPKEGSGPEIVMNEDGTMYADVEEEDKEPQ